MFPSAAPPPLEAPHTLIAQHFVAALFTCGVTPQQLLAVRARVAGVHGATESDAPGPLALQTYGAALVEVTGDPYLGLRVAALVPEGSTGIMEYIFLTAPSIRATEELHQRLAGLAQEYVLHRVRDDHTLCHVELVLPDGLCMAPLLEDYRLGRMVRGVRRALRQPSFQPARVCSTHAAPRELAPYHQTFGRGTELSFAQPLAGMALPSPLANQPLPTSDAVLHAILLRVAGQMLEAIPEPATIAGRVRERLVEALQAGRPSLQRVSKQLGMSERTLRRRLADEQTSFAEQLDQVRAALARVLVQGPDASEKELTRRLGFESTSALRRARKRWAQLSPTLSACAASSDA
jgi:AraC-like DNA-binding protein